MQKRRTINGDEVDVVGRHRRIHTAFGRPGVTDAIKRGMRRRERREAKSAIRNGQNDH